MMEVAEELAIVLGYVWQGYSKLLYYKTRMGVGEQSAHHSITLKREQIQVILF